MMILQHSFSALALATSLSFGGCATRDLASVAERHEGKTARQLGVPSTLWCGDFASLVRREAGMTAIKSRRAIDQARAGRKVERPVRGALMITRRGRGGHHVDIVTRVIDARTVEVIGGNVNRAVTRRIVSTKGALFILPA